MDYKQVILVRTDLGMSKGKMCAQVAHASLESAEKAREEKEEWYLAWKTEGQKKVVLRGDEKSFLEILEVLKNLKIPFCLVKNAGLTEVRPGTITALGIGPAPTELIDKATRDIKLL
jgi:PTH2 family peptidyl-tRNA hydrolase